MAVTIPTFTGVQASSVYNFLASIMRTSPVNATPLLYAHYAHVTGGEPLFEDGLIALDEFGFSSDCVSIPQLVSKIYKNDLTPQQEQWLADNAPDTDILTAGVIWRGDGTPYRYLCDTNQRGKRITSEYFHKDTAPKDYIDWWYAERAKHEIPTTRDTLGWLLDQAYGIVQPYSVLDDNIVLTPTDADTVADTLQLFQVICRQNWFLPELMNAIENILIPSKFGRCLNLIASKETYMQICQALAFDPLSQEPPERTATECLKLIGIRYGEIVQTHPGQQWRPDMLFPFSPPILN